jgi:hypothetical protein
MTSAAELEKLFPVESISKSSRQQYSRQLAKWISLSGVSSIDEVVSRPDAMFKILDQQPLSEHAKKLMVASVCSLLRHSGVLGSKYQEQKDAWSARLRKMNETQFDKTSTMEATPREIVNWVEWEDVLKKERELAKYEFGSDRHLLLALYSLIDPVRADFGDVRVAIDKRSARKYDHKGYNHIFLTAKPGRSFLVLHVYKTSKTYGRFARYIPDELARIIAKNMESNPRQWLIVDTRGNPYDKRNSFTKYVNRVLEELFHKKFTIRMLRHSRISSVDWNETTPKELFAMSKNMHHSIGMQQLYRRKIPKLSISMDGDDPIHPAPSQQPQTAAAPAPYPDDPSSEKKKKKKKKKKKHRTHDQIPQLADFAPGADRTVII